MILRLRIAFAVLWLCCSCAVSAQLGFKMPYVNSATQGTTQNLPVTVTNFDSIVSLQYVIRWNPLVLKYVKVDNFGVPGLSTANFNATHAVDSGYVRLQWEGPIFPGVTLPDGATLFRLRLNTIGPDTSSSRVLFTELTNTFPATYFEAVKVQADTTTEIFEEAACVLKHGYVAIGFTVAATEPESGSALALTAAPNPFSEGTYATFSIEYTADVQVVITDATGRILFQKDMPKLPAGKHGIEIDKAIFPAKGAYFLTVRAGSETSVRTLICN